MLKMYPNRCHLKILFPFFLNMATRKCKTGPEEMPLEDLSLIPKIHLKAVHVDPYLYSQRQEGSDRQIPGAWWLASLLHEPRDRPYLKKAR